MAIEPLLILYRDLVPILNTFARQYRTSYLAPSGRHVLFRTVEDAVRSIVQAFAAMGAPDSHLTSQRYLDIHLQFQYPYHNKKDLPQN